MNRPPLPTGCQEIKSAAADLGMTHKALLKLLRKQGWITNAPGKAQHNLPARSCESAGLLTTSDRAYCLKGKQNIVRMYSVALITPKGMAELKKMINETNEKPNFILVSGNPEPLNNNAKDRRFFTVENEPITQQSGTKEREKCIEQLREWGIL